VIGDARSLFNAPMDASGGACHRRTRELRLPEPMPRLRDHFNEAIARLVDGLADPARRRRAALAFVFGYGVLWLIYAVFAKSSQDVNADMAEMVVWARELALGYPKHPPLTAWILLGWFSVFPLTEWAYFLLSAITLSAGIYLVIELSAEWLEREKLAAVPFLLATIPFYNFLCLKWDQNSLLIPFWALAMWAMMRALDTRRIDWAALAGLAAAAAMLTKYWSVFLLAAMAFAALADRRRGAYFRTAAPWVTAGVFLGAVAPHLYWLIVENFPPVTWVTTRRLAASWTDLLRSFGEYVTGTMAYAGPSLLMVLYFIRPSRAATADSWFPRDDRRTAALMFWTPLLLPFIPAAIKGIVLLSLWNTLALNLLPVMALASPLVIVPRTAVLRMASVVTVLTLLIVVASPFIAFVILRQGVENDAAYARLVMQATEREWRQVTDKPLKLIAGPFILVSSAAFYGTDRPSTYADFSPYLSPWIDDARIAREGVAVMAAADSPWIPAIERYLATAPVARRTEVTLVRNWLGFTNPPRTFVITIIPPRP
jgi:4-amino-4-deoxy-L-arabinose transferase-like glycosyltransferase